MSLQKIVNEEYKQVSPTETGTIIAPKNARIKSLVRSFENYLTTIEKIDSLFLVQSAYSNAWLELRKYPLHQTYTPEDIFNFSILISEYESHSQFDILGFFLSAMINVHAEKQQSKPTYQISTKQYSKKIAGIGCQNEGVRIKVLGSVGGCAGMQMKKGILIITDDAENYLGLHMQGGKIIAKKAGDYVGKNMTYGTIELESCGNFLGTESKNGIIRIKNSFESIGKYNEYWETAEINPYATVSAKIYCKRKRVDVKKYT